MLVLTTQASCLGGALLRSVWIAVGFVGNIAFQQRIAADYRLAIDQVRGCGLRQGDGGGGGCGGPS